MTTFPSEQTPAPEETPAPETASTPNEAPTPKSATATPKPAKTPSVTARVGVRFLESIRALLAGLIIFVLAFPLLSRTESWSQAKWQESEASRLTIVEPDLDDPDPANDGKIVLLTGNLKALEELRDPQFGVTAKALILERTVGMYQWVESKSAESGGQPSYTQSWEPGLISSDGFKQKDGHENPKTIPYEGSVLLQAKGKLGGYAVSQELLSQLTPSQAQDVSGLPAPIQGMTVEEKGFYLGENPAQPQTGDMRIRFRTAPSQTVTVLGKQQGAEVGLFASEDGAAIAKLLPGVHSRDELVPLPSDKGLVYRWLLRTTAWLAMTGGAYLVFRRLKALADAIPYFGYLLKVNRVLFATVTSTLCCAITIGLSWFWLRPFYASLYFATAVIVFLAAWRLAELLRRFRMGR